MSSYKGQNLFGSGPHRVRVGPLGEVAVANYILGRSGSGSTPIGPIELDVAVEGRLVAATLAELRELVDAIESQIVSPPEPGELRDNHGRTFEDMSLITFEPTGPTDRGRSCSLAYTVVFRRFSTG
ncbi:MAG: hypothetical protein ACOYN0_06875 [Phycisphaerales bacterium]